MLVLLNASFILIVELLAGAEGNNDPLFCDSTLVSKHKSKQFEYNSAFDAAMLEAITKENQNGTLCDVNNRNDNAARLASDINDTPELQCTMVVEGVAPCTVSSIEMKLLERDRIFTYHAIKDICIDEGLPSKDKILIECENGKGHHTILHSNGSKNSSMTGEEIELLSPNGSKSSSDDNYHEVESYVCGTEGNVGTELLISDASKSSDSDLDDDFGNHDRSLVLVEAGETNYNETDTIAEDYSSEKSVTNKSAQQSAQIPCSKPLYESPTAVSAPAESNKSNPVNNLSYNSKVERATITFDFNSTKSEASSRDKSTDDINHEQPLKIVNEPRHENGFSGNLEPINEVQHSQGESSFSMAGSMPGLITYSGSIPYSGSVSLRSDSSATSTRSFAFPVLQSEWNSSPVRMAKADRRHYRRHKCWRHGLLCCRF
ncbi:18S pre-ribosomal assembly protein gar2-like protein [Actinidia rufa]|uniref:18S pre-ribosomal assembly protein gar2-like protein n=1 Tax=Actinidia rufa TaxID=165716 RepID=A0A7J0ERD7_9ERIC|nr:18S pre-ribosomal assembly protein gar2-like protein [Actinidia rufa]